MADRRDTRWSERCFECRCKLGPGPWTARPIPRLGGAERDVCFGCAEAIDAQPRLDYDAITGVAVAPEQLAQGIVQVDRAVAHAHHVAEHPTVFEAPIDVADIAEAQGHPLAQTIEDAA